MPREGRIFRPAPLDRAESGTKPRAAIFRSEGEYWTVGFKENPFRLRDSKGLTYLAHLLRHPGTDFQVLDLVGGTTGSDSHETVVIQGQTDQLDNSAIRIGSLGDAGEMLDDRARAEYRRRLSELREELDEAKQLHHDARRERAEREIEALTAELSRAVGLGGRIRHAGSAAERARQSVTKTIKTVIDRAAEQDPEFAAVLAKSIRTGMTCRYDPAVPLRWELARVTTQPADLETSPDDEAKKSALTGKGAPSDQLEQPSRPPTAGRLVWGRFIGRTYEMTALRAAIDAALGGSASLVMLVGEPGIGKTRLAEEAGNYAELRGAQVLVGHCYEGEAASPYSSFVEAIRGYLSTRPDDAVKADMGEGASDVAKLVPEISKRVPDLTPAPAATDPREEQVRLFDSVTSFLINASKADPFMLVLEDLHWADKGSLQLLQHLARRFKQSRLMVVGTYRDVELDRGHPLSVTLAELRRERLCERVLLGGLAEYEVKDLIEGIWQQQLADRSGEAFVRAILRETEGNPFFIEEVLRHLVESGGLYRRAERWVTDLKAIDEMGVPEDVRDVIRRRLARLSEATNEVLEAAAVLGREFEFEVLGRMNEPSEHPAWSAVEEGLGNRLVLESRGGGGPCYAFTHALVRQTLYEELSLPRKCHLHLKAAQAIEAAHKHNLEPYVSALANHYQMAGTAADAAKTIDYSIRAGGAAHALFAHEEAAAHWRAALALMDEQGGGDRKRRAELLWLLGDAIVSTGPKSIEYLEEAAPLVEALGDNQAAIDVHSRLALYLGTMHVGAMDVRRATRHFEKAEALLANQPESWRHANLYLNKAVACVAAKRIVDGVAAAKRSMGIFERLDQGYWSAAAGMLAVHLITRGSVAEGLQLLDQAERRADPIHDTAIGAAVATMGAAIYQFLGDPREAQKWCKRELAKPRTALARKHNVPLQLHHLLVSACIDAGELTQAAVHLADVDKTDKPAELLFFEGEWELAGKRLTSLLEQFRTAGNVQDELLRAFVRARVHRFTGERAEAVQVLQRALSISVGSGDIAIELIARSLLATIDAADTPEALAHVQRCHEIASAGENWLGLAGFVERAEAVVAAALCEYAAAETHFEKAIATFQRYCLPWEEADTFQYWGRALLAASERTRAIEKFEAAIEIYRSHGASARFIDYAMVDKRSAEGSSSKSRVR